jgi:amino acid adenylation domain-containing protein
MPTGSVYNIDHVLRISGELDPAALRGALNELVRRHEVLRTRFGTQNEQPVQVIAPELEIALAIEDLLECAPDERANEAQRRAQAESEAPFDLTNGPLIRARLLRLTPSEHWLLLTLHHIITDGWSSGVLKRELTTLYNAYHRGEPSPLPALLVQYADYALWQRQRLQGAVLEKQLGFWRQALSDLPILDLPTDRPRPLEASYRGGCVKFDVPESLTHSLKALGRREGATLFMTLLAAFQILLFRYSGQEDIAVGAPIAGRTRLELEGLIGFFVNTLVMRGDLSGNPTFSELLSRTRERALDAYSHQDLPFEKLVEESKPGRDLSRNPLFQVMFALENAPETGFRLPGLAITHLPLPRGTAKFDLTLYLTENDGALEGSFEYATDLFDASTIGRMAGHFRELLEGIAADPECGIGELPMLTAPERHQLQVQWNDTAADYPKDRCIHDLFQEQAARHPDAVALVHGDDRLTYGGLNARANRLAHHLRSLGAGPEALIGICMERCPDMVVGMLGVLKAGGAFVPLDPNCPGERLAFMLRDTEVRVLLTHRALLDLLPTHDGPVVCLDRDAASIAACSSADLPAGTSADALAYVIYTSGSTGQPKGVMVPHRGIARLVCNTDYIELGPDDCVAHLSNPSFDAATFEIWGALLNGARLAIIPRDIVLDPPRLVAELRRRGVTTVFLTTALFNLIVRSGAGAFAGMKHVLFGGEAVDPQSVRDCLAAGPPARLLHVYGPTETVTFATWHRVAAVGADERNVPIGRPLANMRLAVLDRHRQPVPIGVAGELNVGGEGIARGYWKRPELTAARFVADPFAPNAGALMYRTGDLVRYRPDGNVEFLGRLDQQLKLRGHRVEPGEIETVLVRDAGMREAVVVLREDAPGDKRLVAYVVAGAAVPGAADLRALLKSKLPDYMLPAAFVALAALPLTPNGKIDRAALPAPAQGGSERESSFVAPRDNVELHLVKIWEDLLKQRKVGVRDNFFDLGGHSLLAVQLITRIDITFNQKLPIDILWAGEGTVEALANALREGFRPGADPELVPIKTGSRRPLFVMFTIAGRLFFYYELARRLHPEQAVYGLQARGVFDAGRPDDSIEAIAAHCIQTMRKVQPTGPYLLAGYSAGGVVAYEVARQLTAAGHVVAMLALLDTFAPPATFARLWRNQLSGTLRGLTKPRQLQEFLYFAVLHPLQLGRLRQLRTTGEAHRWAHWSFRPRSLATTIELFVAEKSVGQTTDDSLGWSRWSQGAIRIHRLPGGHTDLVKPPVVDDLAARLQACIDSSAPASTTPDVAS